MEYSRMPLRLVSTFLFLLLLDSSFVYAKITKWDDFTEPLKVKFEMMYGANESIEVFIPEGIIKNYEKVKLNLDITSYNFEYAEPYIKINDSNWTTYNIKNSKEVNIKTKHLLSGINKLTLSTRKMMTQAFKISEIRFEFDNIEEIKNKYSKTNKSKSIPVKMNILNQSENSNITEKEKLEINKQKEEVNTLQKELAALKEALDFDTSLDISDRKNLQQGLKILGYYNGTVDGDLGNHTRQSIKQYQDSLNENQTGYLNKENAVRIIQSGKTYFEKAEIERIKREKEEIVRQKELEKLKDELRKEIKKELMAEIKKEQIVQNNSIVNKIEDENIIDKKPFETKVSTNSSTKIDTNQSEALKVEKSQQQEFIDSIQSFIREYRSAPNELKKSAIRTKRKNAIKAVLKGNLKVHNWIGELKTMETNSEGKAIVSVVLKGSKIRVQTWNNFASDFIDNTLIEQGTQLFNKIAELSKGSEVVFSGAFISSEEDYIGEQSLTEKGSMTEPEFTLKFYDIEKM